MCVELHVLWLICTFWCQKGTSGIEIVYLDCHLNEVAIEWNGMVFKKMKNLKTVIVKSGHFSEGRKHFPSSLRVLEEYWNDTDMLHIVCHLTFTQRNLSYASYPIVALHHLSWLAY